ncbi:MAG: Sapep family Mn(2+)-dependent dipeptidase [Cytophagales bacterium]|nr:Sapep family Mn(2+)-dependent dipeptidase [Armatimonadota bacterium]
MKDKISAWVDAHESEIIARTQAILRLPSVKAPTAGSGAPFGTPIAEALHQTLSLCGDLGMKTENFGGYAGHAEFGTGSEIVGMLGHLDVVPPGEGWTHDPWGAEVSEGFIWGRGTSDDKGPTFAALFGAKAVFDLCAAEGIPLSRRVRLIFGCDEESGWECMAHYFGPAGQPKPTLAFTPDAYFPLVYAEKGSFTAVGEKQVPEDRAALLRVAWFESGLRPNMVPRDAGALLVGDSGLLEGAEHVLVPMSGITAERTADGLLVRALGKSAHGSTPGQGDNAAIKLMRALTSQISVFDDLSSADSKWMTDLALRGAPDGGEVGIGGSDEVTGALTSNLGVVQYREGVVRATFNVRYPATWDGDETTGRFRASVEKSGWTVASLSHTPPLYVPQDQEPVKTLLRVYREQTGDTTTAPLTMGGRTYATSVAPVGVAFGAAMPGDEDCAHQADERFPVARLLQCAKIYGHALYELAK